MGHEDQVLPTAVGNVAHHEHIGLIFRTAEEKIATLIPFIKAGLDRREKCVFLCHKADIEKMAGELSAGGLDFKGAIETGALLIDEHAEWPFGAACAGDALETAYADAMDGGYVAVRVILAMVCEGGEGPPVESLRKNRGDIIRFFLGRRATGLFLYDAAIMGREEVMEAVATHPWIVHGGTLCKNFYFSAQEGDGRMDDAGIRVERILDSLKERQLAEHALQESEGKYRALMNEAGDVILLADAEGNILDGNRKAQELLGYTREELAGMHMLDIHPESELPKAVAGYHQAAQKGSGRFPDMQVKAKNGRIFPVEIVSTAIEYGGRKVMQGIFHDITHRKQVEKALRESEELYRQMFDRSKTVSLLIDPLTGEIVDANVEASAFYGYTKDDLRRMRITYLNTLSADEVFAEMRAAAAEERNYFHFRHRLARGEMRDVDVYSGPVEVGGRKLLHSVIFDVTKRKRAEEALQESQERYRNLVELLPDAVVVHTSGRIVFLNDAAVKLMGLARAEDGIGKPVLDFVHPDYREEVIKRISVPPGTGALPMIEEKFVRADGEVIDVEVAAMPITFEGKPSRLAVFRDVTARKQAQRAMKESEERFRMFSDIADEGVLIHIQGIIVDVNQALVRMSGYSAEECIGKSAFDMIAPEWRGLVQENIMAGYGKPYEIEGLTKDGARLSLEVQGRVIPYKGQTARVTVVRDISGRKRAEEALREGEAEYRSVVNSTSEGFWRINGKLNTVDVNDALCRMLGYTREEMLGEKPYAFMDGRNVEMLKSRMAQVTDTRHISLELALRRKSGENIPVVVNGTVLFSPSGELHSAFAFVSDISQRKLVEEELRNSKEGLDAAQRIARMGNWDWAIVDNKLSWSDEIYRIFGLAPREFGATYEAFLDAVHPDDRQGVIDGVNAALEGRSQYNMDHRIVLQDGSIKVVHEQAEVYRNAEGAPVRMVGTVQDITERKVAEEEQVRARKEAEEATKIKDKFVSLVSHDLKGPLATMLGFLRMVREDETAKIPGQTKELFDTALGIGRKMAGLIDELLNISRLKTGKVALDQKFLDAHFLADAAIIAFASLAAEKGIELKNAIPPKTRVYADYVLFSQVLQNLISNAIKFTRQGGHITLSLPPGQRSTIAVADTGVGISPENMGTLFSYDVKTTTRGTGGEMGSGLGLPLCYDIMRVHGGILKVESEVGKGSVFQAILPYLRPAILLVDDDDLTLRIIKEMLKGHDCDVATAMDGREALHLAGLRPPHLVITDLQMPEMDGYELIRSIRAHPLLKAIPIIAITGKAASEKEEILRQGADDFIVKSSLSSELLLRVGKFIP